MKASELKPGQFFESSYKYDGETPPRNLCIAHTETHALYVQPPFDEVLLYHHNNHVTPLAVTGWDDEPQSEPDGVSLIAAERERQIAKEGWSSEHDDSVNRKGELAKAAICYAATSYTWSEPEKLELIWPYDSEWWKPSATSSIRNLVKAGALIAAEIDRLKRTKPKPQSEPASISKELNIDAGTEQFELARALHRVVRAMHDGHCPKCGHLACSMEFEPSEGYHCCPNCEFAITKEESDEALAMFLPYMQKNYDKFVAWQLHGRFIKPKPQSEPASISKELNIDAGTEQFELARALHRVVRAMHDGHCPKCGHLACSMEFEPSEGYHCCPNCEFAITKEESDEALAMFLPYMQKNYDKFVAWQLHGRFIKPAKPTPAPLQLREGAWYRRDDNAVVGPANKLAPGDVQSWKVGDWWYPNDGKFLLEYPRRKHDFDLIAEVPPPVEPVQFKAGDWVVCVDNTGDAEPWLIWEGVYRIARLKDAYINIEGSTKDFFATRFRLATPAEVAKHLSIYKQVDSKPTEADIRKFSWCVDTWLSMQKGDN